MSLVKLIAQADERGLAASGLACLDRCLPLLVEDTEVLRPLWAGVVAGERDWPGRLEASTRALDAAVEAEPFAGAAEVSVDEAAALVRSMLGAAPPEWAAGPLRDWADACSLAALDIHHRFDSAGESGTPEAAERLARAREDTAAVADAVDGAEGTDGVGPLVAGELRRQIRILEILAEPGAGTGAAGVRQVMDLSTEGQRVLRAVVSRRARARS